MVIVEATDSATFESWTADSAFAAMERHPTYGARGRRYFAAVFGQQRQQTSFGVFVKDRPVVLVACAVGDATIDHWGLPLRLFASQFLPEAETESATTAAFDHLNTLAERHGARLTIRDNDSGGGLSAVGDQCHRRGYAARMRFTGQCDLSHGEEGMRRGLRKSFKSLLNWGRRNLSVVSVDGSNPDRVLFSQYQEFHLAVAGRSTRPQESWDATFDWIASGNGELVLGRLGNELVAATVVLDGSEWSTYASGVYDRAQFDKPLAHWPLSVAMLNAHKRGIRNFDLGEIPLKGTVSDKEYAIGYFKRGFATSIRPWIEWSSAAAGTVTTEEMP